MRLTPIIDLNCTTKQTFFKRFYTCCYLHKNSFRLYNIETGCSLININYSFTTSTCQTKLMICYNLNNSFIKKKDKIFGLNYIEVVADVGRCNSLLYGTTYKISNGTIIKIASLYFSPTVIDNTTNRMNFMGYHDLCSNCA